MKLTAKINKQDKQAGTTLVRILLECYSLQDCNNLMATD